MRGPPPEKMRFRAAGGRGGQSWRAAPAGRGGHDVQVRQRSSGACSSPPPTSRILPLLFLHLVSPHHARQDQRSPLHPGPQSRPHPQVHPPVSGHQRAPVSTRVRSRPVQPTALQDFHLPGAQVLPTWSPRPCTTCSCPLRWPSPPPSLPLTHSAPATQAPWLFLQHVSPVLPQDLCIGCARYRQCPLLSLLLPILPSRSIFLHRLSPGGEATSFAIPQGLGQCLAPWAFKEYKQGTDRQGNKTRGGCAEIETLVHGWCECETGQTLAKGLVVLPKVKSRTTI